MALNFWRGCPENLQAMYNFLLGTKSKMNLYLGVISRQFSVIEQWVLKAAWKELRWTCTFHILLTARTTQRSCVCLYSLCLKFASLSELILILTVKHPYGWHHNCVQNPDSVLDTFKVFKTYLQFCHHSNLYDLWFRHNQTLICSSV